MENEVEKACPLLHQKAATPETVLKVASIHTNSKATPSQKESSSQGEERPMEKLEPATQDKLLNTRLNSGQMHNKRRRCHSVLDSISILDSISKRNLPKCTVKFYIPIDNDLSMLPCLDMRTC